MKKTSLKNKLLGAFAAVACMFGGGAAMAQQADVPQKPAQESQVVPGSVMQDGSIYFGRRGYGLHGNVFAAAEDAPKLMKQEEAKQYCEQLDAHGKKDWHLPYGMYIAILHNEHVKLDALEQRRQRENMEYQVKKPFNLKNEWYWSATKDFMTVYFGGDKHRQGYEVSRFRVDGEMELNVRCVRVDQDPPPERPVPAGGKMADGTFVFYDRYDVWSEPRYMMKGTSPRMQTFDDARKYCESLHGHGRDDWRLPTSQEAALIRRVLKDEKLNNGSAVKKSLTISTRPEYDRFWAAGRWGSGYSWGSSRWNAANDDEFYSANQADRAYSVCVRQDKPKQPK